MKFASNSLTMLVLMALSTTTLLLNSNHDLRAAETRSPFDGKSFAAWTTLDGKAVSGGWEIIDGMIHLSREAGRSGHIVTRTEYGDFTLSFEWKIAAGGNSGLKYRVRRYGDKVLGLEYQIYDDLGAKNKVAPKNSVGSLYDLYEPNSAKQVNPAGEWNHAKIVVQGNRIEHWLNGKQIVAANIGDEEWKKKVEASKFNDVPEFSLNTRGKLMLTDHGSEVWYRNFEFESKD